MLIYDILTFVFEAAMRAPLTDIHPGLGINLYAFMCITVEILYLPVL